MKPLHLLLLFVMFVCACPATNAPQPIPPSPTPASGYQPPVEPPPPPPPAIDAGAVAEPPPATPQPDGSRCLTAGDCSSGVCEGLGCTADAPGVCAPARRSCTKDRRAYCSCQGSTFYGSGSCPGQRYAVKGACPNG